MATRASARIFCFSGTGNTLMAAEDLATGLGETAHSTAHHLSDDPPVSSAGLVGIACPVDYGYLPPVARRVAGRLVVRADAYLFGILTCGGSIGESVEKLHLALSGTAAGLPGAHDVHTPRNGFRKAWDHRALIVSGFRRRSFPGCSGRSGADYGAPARRPSSARACSRPLRRVDPPPRAYYYVPP